TIQAAAIGFRAGFAAVATCSRAARVRGSILERRVIDRRGASANPDAAALRGAAEAAVLHSVLRNTAALAAVRGAIQNACAIDVERAAFDVDRSAQRICALAIIEVAAVATNRRVTGESVAGNDHSTRSQTAQAASMRIERRVIVDHAI